LFGCLTNFYLPKLSLARLISDHGFYLLKMLRDGGMPLAELGIIFCSLVICRISYRLATWGEYLNA
jgi:hypothetical protein